eukprot:scaffold18116_cov123-Isochrysis_galbana.AAC.2
MEHVRCFPARRRRQRRRSEGVVPNRKAVDTWEEEAPHVLVAGVALDWGDGCAATHHLAELREHGRIGCKHHQPRVHLEPAARRDLVPVDEGRGGYVRKVVNVAQHDQILVKDDYLGVLDERQH